MLQAELQIQQPANEVSEKDAKKASSYFQVPESIKQFFEKNPETYSLEVRKQKKHLKHIIFTIFGIILALLIIVSIVVASLVSGNSNETSKMSNLTDSLTEVSRKEWQAKHPNEKISNLTLPVHIVIISETNTDNCSSTAACSSLVRKIQDLDMSSKGLQDISFNFLVGGDKKVYEGRGWYQQGAASEQYNDRSIQIALIGTFDDANQNKAQLHACSLLISKGIQLGYIEKNFKFFIQKHFKATIFFEEIPSWDDWIRQFLPTVF